MVREDAAVSRILQPEDGAKNRLTLHGKRLGQNFHDVTTGRAMGSSVPFGQAKLFEAALACRNDLPSLDPNRYLKAAIAYCADNSALRRHQHFALLARRESPLGRDQRRHRRFFPIL
jgi:hypothetical protein